MARPRSRPMDVKVMCALWRDPEFTGMTATAQLMCIRGVGMLGRDCSLGGKAYHSADFMPDLNTFEIVAREIVHLGAWAWLDYDTVEVGQYRPHIILTPKHRTRIPQWVRSAILDRDGHRCVNCGSPDRLEMDHIHPWSLGGSDEPTNLQSLCRTCNYEKGANA